MRASFQYTQYPGQVKGTAQKIYPAYCTASVATSEDAMKGEIRKL